MAQCQIGAKVLIGACSSLRSHQFIFNVLEYIHIDGLLAYEWFLSLKTTNKILLCIDKWRPPNLSFVKSLSCGIKIEIKHEKKPYDNISSHPMPHQYCPAQDYLLLAYTFGDEAWEG